MNVPLFPLPTRVQDLYKEAFKDVRGGVDHFEFIKFHTLTHYPDSIRRYGSQLPLSGFHWEASMKDLVKIPYNMTGKQCKVFLAYIFELYYCHLPASWSFCTIGSYLHGWVHPPRLASILLDYTLCRPASCSFFLFSTPGSSLLCVSLFFSGCCCCLVDFISFFVFDYYVVFPKSDSSVPCAAIFYVSWNISSGWGRDLGCLK